MVLQQRMQSWACGEAEVTAGSTGRGEPLGVAAGRLEIRVPVPWAMRRTALPSQVPLLRALQAGHLAFHTGGPQSCSPTTTRGPLGHTASRHLP